MLHHTKIFWMLCLQLCRNSFGKALLYSSMSLEPWPQPHLWDELEWRLRARLSRPTSVPDLTNNLLSKWAKFPAETSQKSERGGINFILMSMYLECSVIKFPVGVMVRCRNTKHCNKVMILKSATKMMFWSVKPYLTQGGYPFTQG